MVLFRMFPFRALMFHIHALAMLSGCLGGGGCDGANAEFSLVLIFHWFPHSHLFSSPLLSPPTQCQASHGRTWQAWQTCPDIT